MTFWLSAAIASAISDSAADVFVAIATVFERETQQMFKQADISEQALISRHFQLTEFLTPLRFRYTHFQRWGNCVVLSRSLQQMMCC